MTHELSPSRSLCILGIVAGCFAILWPSIFYPMLQSSTYKNVDNVNGHHQERPPHAKPPSLLHPAFREPSARPIPKPSPSSASHKLPRETHAPPANVISGKKPPIAGMRPPMGGGGPLPIQKGNGSMSVVMPIYTVCIVIFFGYTMMRFMCKKQNTSVPNEYVADPKFYQHVFNDDSLRRRTTERTPTANNDRNTDATPKLGLQEKDIIVSAISSLLQEVNRDILERETNDLKDENQFPIQLNESVDENEEKATEQSPSTQLSEDEVQTEIIPASNKLSKPSSNGNIPTNNEVRVIGTEINECYEDGQRWRCSTPTRPKSNRSPSPMEMASTHDILLTATVPSNSQILISDARTEKVDGEEPCIVLESKVTLNVVSNNLQESEDEDSDRSDDDNVESNVPAEPLIQHSDRKHVEIDEETDDEDAEEVEEETESDEEEEVEVEVEEETDDDDGS